MDTLQEKELPSFTIEQLAGFLDDQRMTIGKEFIMIRNTFSSDLFRYPCRIKALVGVLCTGGTVHFKRNIGEYSISPGMMFINTPNDIVQVDEIDRFTATVVMVSEDFIKDMSINLTNLLSMHPVMLESPSRQLTVEELRFFGQLADTLELLILQPETKYKLETIKGIMVALVYKLCDIFLDDNNRHTTSILRNRQRAMYEQFMLLLNKHHCREHSIKFYADQICISPKYLSAVIKQISGRSAAEWIDEYVILEAKNLLRYSTMNIQEIAYYLNFTTQSFFGKYFKHLTGITPGQYRALK